MIPHPRNTWLARYVERGILSTHQLQTAYDLIIRLLTYHMLRSGIGVVTCTRRLEFGIIALLEGTASCLLQTSRLPG